MVTDVFEEDAPTEWFDLKPVRPPFFRRVLRWLMFWRKQRMIIIKPDPGKVRTVELQYHLRGE